MKKYNEDELENMYIKTFYNSRSLVEESEILLKHKKYARSYTLSLLAREELAKLIILSRLIFDMLNNNKVNSKEVKRRMSNHQEKLRINYIYLEILSGGIHSQGIEDTVRQQNTLKNASLYAGFSGDDFYSPLELVTEESAKSSFNATKKILAHHESLELHQEGNLSSIFKNPEFSILRKNTIEFLEKFSL